MKRAMGILGVVVVLLAMVALPASAAGDNNCHRWGGSVFSLVGEVVQVDATAGTLTVAVHTGNGTIQDLGADQVLLTTNTSTLFLRNVDPKCEVISLAEIKAGDWVSAHGRVLTVDGQQVFLAERVTVDVLHTTA